MAPDSATEKVGADLSEVGGSNTETFATEDEPDVGGNQVPGRGHENVPDGDHTDEVEDIMSELLDPVGESNVGGCLTEEFNHLNGHRL